MKRRHKAFLLALSRRKKPYPPLPPRWDRGMPEPEAFQHVWAFLIWCAFIGLEVGIMRSLCAQ